MMRVLMGPEGGADTQGGRGSRPTTRFPRAWLSRQAGAPKWRPRPRHGGGCERVGEVRVRCATRVCTCATGNVHTGQEQSPG